MDGSTPAGTATLPSVNLLCRTSPNAGDFFGMLLDVLITTLKRCQVHHEGETPLRASESDTQPPTTQFRGTTSVLRKPLPDCYCKHQIDVLAVADIDDGTTNPNQPDAIGLEEREPVPLWATNTLQLVILTLMLLFFPLQNQLGPRPCD